MAKGDSVAITYYVGFVNILLALIWTGVYTLGFTTSGSITNPSATPFYVGTLFAVGFGLLYPSIENSQGKQKVKLGMGLSLFALVCYSAMIAAHFMRGGLILYDLKSQF